MAATWPDVLVIFMTAIALAESHPLKYDEYITVAQTQELADTPVRSRIKNSTGGYGKSAMNEDATRMLPKPNVSIKILRFPSESLIIPSGIRETSWERPYALAIKPTIATDAPEALQYVENIGTNA